MPGFDPGPGSHNKHRVNRTQLARDEAEVEMRLAELRATMADERNRRAAIMNRNGPAGASAGAIWSSGASGRLRGYAPGTIKRGDAQKVKNKTAAAAAAAAASSTTTTTATSKQTTSSWFESDENDMLALPMTGDAVKQQQQHTNQRPSNAQLDALFGPSRRLNELAGQTNEEEEETSLLDGAYDEREAANSFQEALREWRSGGGTSTPAAASPAPEPEIFLATSATDSGTQSAPPPPPTRPGSAQRQSYFMRMRMREESKLVGELAAMKVNKS
ncbi:hypothetical protein RI054_18g81740 [Pseudoscourfieldia marina]